MAVLQTIRNLFVPAPPAMPEVVVPAPPTKYSIRNLTMSHLEDVLRLNLRCFRNGENYTKHTFNYLLNEPNTLSYRIVSTNDEMAGFICVMINADGAAHITTIGVAPEHRRRKLAESLLAHLEDALKIRNIGTVVLEVRESNVAAQRLYESAGYIIVQHIAKYYNNGEDGFLMMKSLV
ncbi:MAG: ribosomal protein S18-alanine N-acetyltransferase [Saprospiraceae bacterium]|nr:ribosomal protein S18-alanine N-acetyltransferase [Pyrinomonadaceae bacterium]